MNRFEVLAPADLDSAARLLAKPNHAAIAGGVDLVDLLKQQIATPATLVNLKVLPGLNAIRPLPDGGLSIGPLVRLSEVAVHPVVREKFTALAQSAQEAATPQIRNLGTVGGNLLQRPRCWYFRNPDVHCLKKGGDKCYAIGGLNRYHSILGGGPSFIVHPSNLAPALVAFGASIRIQGAGSTRTVALDQFFTLPQADPTRENSLKQGEIVVEVILPARPRVRSVYLEAREKQTFDWPLVSVAAVIGVALSGQVRDASIVMGAVAPIPWRAPEAEKALHGARIDRERAAAAAEAALKDAQPMSDNAYKVPIAKALMRRAIMQAAGIEAA